MKKPIFIPGGATQEILRPLKGRAADIVFRTKTADGTPPTGQVIESSRGMIGRNAKIHELKEQNRLRIGHFRQGYVVSVCPDQDVEVQVLTNHTELIDVLKYVGIGLGAAVLLSLFFRLIGGGD